MKILCIFGFLIFSMTSCDTEVSKIEHLCGTIITSCSTEFSYFESKALPKSILNSAEEELLKYIAKEDLLEYITFLDYNYIDTCEHSRNLEWIAPRFVLHFDWKQFEESIISSYCFTVELDSKGDLLEPIKLANSRLIKERLKAISYLDFKDIWNDALERNFHAYQIGFDFEKQICTLEFVEYKDSRNSDVLMTKNVEYFNLHNGMKLE